MSGAGACGRRTRLSHEGACLSGAFNLHPAHWGHHGSTMNDCASVVR